MEKVYYKYVFVYLLVSYAQTAKHNNNSIQHILYVRSLFGNFGIIFPSRARVLTIQTYTHTYIYFYI